ncbi:Re/Si-specific NAD(P)(+) transhydrogenase subunit alpha [Planctomycetales bacterium ZRK34]|nr:Re/Si-specific NAD(P)(+) transhydrogenase subunit alpha [Planctomycetales bacterium ZRK34]
MIVGVPKETFPDERRVALTPDAVGVLAKLKVEVVIETGAGQAAGFVDDAYKAKGARIAANRSEVFQDAQIIAQVRCYGANPDNGSGDLDLLKPDQIVIGHCEPLMAHEPNKAITAKGSTVFAMELIPRTTRAQAMDVLSSQANLAGYKGVLIATEHLRKVFPMMMTPAGTIKPSRVFIVGAGVAGLQAIATAKRLGSIVSAIDVRPAVKEQVESLGAKFIAPPGMAEGEGGYAAELTDEQKAEQQKMMADTIAESDVVITTAAIPGRPSPKLIAADVVARMKPGAVIVDLASERGGNCELTEPGKIIEKNGVTIVGLTNVASLVAQDATVMYAGNIVNLLKLMFDKEGNFKLNMEDDVIAGTVMCKDGEIVHPKVRELMGLPALEKPAEEKPAEEAPASDEKGSDA